MVIGKSDHVNGDFRLLPPQAAIDWLFPHQKSNVLELVIDLQNLVISQAWEEGHIKA